MDMVMVMISVACGLVALHLLWLVVRGSTITDVTLYLMAALELGLVVQLVIGVGQVLGPHGGLNVVAYLGYLVGALVILPIAFLWAAAEQSRSGTAVLLVATIALPVLELRLHDLWVAR